MPGLDVFHNDAFSLLSLTASVNKMPFVPGRVGRLGLFEEAGVATTTITIEEYNGTLSLIPTTKRGAPATQNKHAKRDERALVIPHLAVEDTILADEVQNVRAFGTESELQTVQNVANLRMAEMIKKHDATVEYGRVGAIKGVIYDSDGATTIYNLFTEFNVTQQTKDFTLGTSTTNILGDCQDVSGMVEDELGAAMYDHIHVLCSPTFYKNFVAHANVQKAYQYFQQSGQTQNPLRDDLRYDPQGFTFGGLTFEQYRGKVNGVSFIPDGDAYAFPVGVPGLFLTRYAPADFAETVNTIGLPRYAKIAPDPSGFNRSVTLHTQSNPLSFCTRPRTMIRLFSST